MRTIWSILGALGVALGAGAAPAGKLVFGVYPDALISVNETDGSLAGRVKLASGLPTSMRMSTDKKRIYVTTITTGGIEVIDAATMKVVNQFSLNTPTTRYRFNGGVPDPTGKYFYTIVTQIDKKIDHYEISKAKYAVVDLAKHQIVKMVEMAKEDQKGAFGYRNSMMLSEDGKTMYEFRDRVLVVNVADFKVVDRIDLAKPETSGLEATTFGGQLDSISTPGVYTSLFNASDPYIHSKSFGIGKFDLATRQFAFTPIGPAPASMAGLQVAPDGKTAYTVVTTGTYGNKRCEFWRFDMAKSVISQRAEFPCRSRFQLGISADGNKLYIHGASFDVEVYDAATLKYERTWNLENDVTGAGLIVTG